MNQDFKEISDTIKKIDPILEGLQKTNLTEDIKFAITRLTEGFYEYKRFFLTYHDIINNYVFFKNSSNSIINSLTKLESTIPKKSNLLLSSDHNHDHIKNVKNQIIKVIEIINNALLYCKDNKNYNLIKPLQNLENKSSNLINIYENLHPIILKNNQLKNFFLENKYILYISQEAISKLTTLSLTKDHKEIDKNINEIIEIFNKTIKIENRNLNGSVDNLYYQMLSLYRTRISLIN